MPLAILVDIRGKLDKCGPDCPVYLAKWGAWCNQYEGKRLALIKIEHDQSYFDSLDTKSRNMLRKVAKRNYLFHSFNYNDYLQDMYEINTSKKTRQGKPMSDGYLEYPTRISSDLNLSRCELHTYFRIGGFKEGKMYAYCALAVVNELAILNTIIGHADALTDGVMNGLIYELVKVCKSRRYVKYLNYLTMESSGDGLQAFKRSVGFESYEVSFNV